MRRDGGGVCLAPLSPTHREPFAYRTRLVGPLTPNSSRRPPTTLVATMTSFHRGLSSEFEIYDCDTNKLPKSASIESIKNIAISTEVSAVTSSMGTKLP